VDEGRREEGGGVEEEGGHGIRMDGYFFLQLVSDELSAHQSCFWAQWRIQLIS